MMKHENRYNYILVRLNERQLFVRIKLHVIPTNLIMWYLNTSKTVHFIQIVTFIIVSKSLKNAVL